MVSNAKDKQTRKGNDKPRPHTRQTTKKTRSIRLEYETSILINDDPLGHTFHDLGVEFDSVVSREADFFGEVVGKNVHEIGVSICIQQWFVCELSVFVAES